MQTIYLCEQGALVKKKSKRLLVFKGKDLLYDVPVSRVHRIIIYGNVQITTQALALLLDNCIDVSFFTSRGRFRGQLGSGYSKNVFLRLAQFKCWSEKDYKLRICRSIVKAKLTNMRRLLMNYTYNYPNEDFQSSIYTIEKGIDALDSMDDVSRIMGVEGSSSRVYFMSYSKMFRQELMFSKRIKHPSPDPVNALLSLGYVMITNELSSLLEGNNFDPFLGFLHGVKYGRKSLALDLVEEFRQPVIDRFTLRLANLKVFSSDDFMRVKEGGVHLKDEAFKKYLSLYDKRLREGSEGESNLSWKDVFKEQVSLLEKSIMERGEYTPFIMK